MANVYDIPVRDQMVRDAQIVGGPLADHIIQLVRWLDDSQFGKTQRAYHEWRLRAEAAEAQLAEAREALQAILNDPSIDWIMGGKIRDIAVAALSSHEPTCPELLKIGDCDCGAAIKYIADGADFEGGETPRHDCLKIGDCGAEQPSESGGTE